MSRIARSRRTFLKSLGTLATSAAGFSDGRSSSFGQDWNTPVWSIEPYLVGPAPSPWDRPSGAQASRVRLNIASLGPQLESLRAGVACMKSLPEWDRRSWKYQANIHGMLGATKNKLFDTC